MTKSQLTQVLAERNVLPLREAEIVVNTVFRAMSEALIRGDRIEIRGFGSITIKNYPSYVGRNPKTGQPIQVKAKRLPFFKVGKELRERVDGRYVLNAP